MFKLADYRQLEKHLAEHLQALEALKEWNVKHGADAVEGWPQK
jgi:hypothetical protein